MEVKGTNIYLQASELPVITNILSGDSFVVQTPAYPTIIKFYDIIIDPVNTTFYNNIPTNQTNIYTISADTLSLSSFILSNNYVPLTTYNSYSNSVVNKTQTAISDTSVKINDGFNYLQNTYQSQITAITGLELSPKAWVIFDNNLSIIAATTGIANIELSGSNVKITFDDFLTNYFNGKGGFTAIATAEGNSGTWVNILTPGTNADTELHLRVIKRSNKSFYATNTDYDYVNVVIYSL